jgi:protein dithiol oxidoreductase (disulfide-forming)
MRIRPTVLLALLLALAPAGAHDGHQHGPGLQPISDGITLQPADGKLEVVEVFAYTCGHCANFQPILDAWLRKAPARVRFAYLPAAFNPNDAYARGYFAAEALGVLKQFHDAAFEAIHRTGALPASHFCSSGSSNERLTLAQPSDRPTIRS